MILAQGRPLELRLEKDAPQIGMASEADPEEIEDLSLQPVRGGPEGDDRVDLRPLRPVRLDDPSDDTQPVVTLWRMERVDDREARLHMSGLRVSRLHGSRPRLSAPEPYRLDASRPDASGRVEAVDGREVH